MQLQIVLISNRHSGWRVVGSSKRVDQ